MYVVYYVWVIEVLTVRVLVLSSYLYSYSYSTPINQGTRRESYEGFTVKENFLNLSGKNCRRLPPCALIYGSGSDLLLYSLGTVLSNTGRYTSQIGAPVVRPRRIAASASRRAADGGPSVGRPENVWDKPVERPWAVSVTETQLSRDS